MLNRDPLFDQQIRAGATPVVRCDVLANGVPVLTGVPVSAATVSLDRGQFVRRTCDVAVPDPALIPYVATDPLQPWGKELRLWRGVVLPDGRESVVPVGTFVIWATEFDDPFGGVKITGYDRAKLIQQARFLYPRTVPAGSLVSRLRTLALEAVPWAGFASTVGDATAGAVTYDKQRDQACTDIATALGAEFYADPWGVLTLGPIPDPQGAVVWQMDSADAVVSATRTATRDGVYNAVVATSSTSGVDTPVSAIVTDDDPWSPTYFGGVSLLTGTEFGQSPYFFDSPLLTTVGQCRTAAAGILRDTIGLQQTVQVTSMMQPALEPGDVIGIRFPDGAFQHHVAESWELDLAGGGMQVQTRSTTYAAQ